MDEKMLSVAEAAERLGVTRGRVNIFIREGRLPAVRIGRSFALRESDVEAFAKQPRQVGWPKGRKKNAEPE